MKKKILTVQGVDIVVFVQKSSDYISLTDIARHKNKSEPKDIVKNWMRSRSTIKFLGLWEKLNNPHFKGVEFDSFMNEAGSNYFVLSPQKWIEKTGSIGIVSRSGRNGGTFAHKDIAFEFASWISSEFKLFLIKEFQRLQEEENERLSLGWDLCRNLTKINYKIHTDAIKAYLIPKKIDDKDVNFVYASEADVLNKALFGMTAKEWKDLNPARSGNIRDYAFVSQLVCLANLESHNAELIRQGMLQSQRLIRLNEIAIIQMRSLVENSAVKKLATRPH